MSESGAELSVLVSEEFESMAMHEPPCTSREPIRAPLNSRWLTGKCLKLIATALKLPAGAPNSDLLVMIEAKVTEQGHEPGNVQVVMEEGTLQGRITLQDEEGEFLDVEPLKPDSVQEQPAEEDSDSSGSSDSSGPGLQRPGRVVQVEGEELALLRRDLEEARFTIETLMVEA